MKKLSASLLCLILSATTAKALDFERACEPAQKTIVIGAVGDFLMHKPLQVTGYNSKFENLWRGVQSRIDEVSLMYGNLETPVAQGVTASKNVLPGHAAIFDNHIYSGYPMFNTHEKLLVGIKTSGFDILSTANNHSMDRGPIGVDKTIEALEKYQIPYTGTRAKGSATSFTKTISVDGFDLAFIACTFSLNGFTDPHDQVLECYSEKAKLLAEVRAAAKIVDAVIVTPHWGIEYTNAPTAREVALGKELIEVGAAAVIATHPHVIQPIRKHKTSDGREGAIIYSTGNFISNQQGQKKIGLMAFVGLSKGASGAWVNGVRYSPTYMVSAATGLKFLDQTSASSTYSDFVNQVMKDNHGFLASNEALLTNPECF